MSRNADIYSTFGERITIGTGASLGVYDITAKAGQAAIQLKLLSGGTLEIGDTSATFGTAYPMSTNEVYSCDCSGRMRLLSSGATCIVGVLRGKTAGQ